MKQDNRGLLAVLGVLMLVLLLGPVLMSGMMGARVIGPGMMGWGSMMPGVATGTGWAWGLGVAAGGLMTLAFWGALIVCTVVLVRAATGQPTGSGQATRMEDPLAILRRRYAAGDIDEQTYLRMRSQLSDEQRSGQPVRVAAPVTAAQ